MNISVKKGKLGASKAALLVSLLTPEEVKKISNKAQLSNFPSVSGMKKNLALFFKNRKFTAKSGQSASLVDVDKTYLFIGWEEKKNNWDKLEAYRKLGASITAHASKSKAQTVALAAGNVSFEDADSVAAFVEGLELSEYSFDQFRSKKVKEFSGVKSLEILSANKVSLNVLPKTRALIEATKLARDLVNTPASVCTPTYLVEKAKEIAKESGMQIEILDRKKLEKIGAGSFLSVSNGSEQPPFLIKLTYKPKNYSGKNIALIGKGITFDTGGYSIKTADGMESMKNDMSGAAAVLATMRAIAKTKPNIEVRAYIPTCENMINGKATRPGDIVTAMSGKTIEILNTDAEGRLILADALTLAESEGAETMIDVATLTGAIVVALGTKYAGLFANDDQLAQKIIDAGVRSGEHFWRMPLAEEYKDLIKSPIADIKNIGGRWGGAITAAMFLKEFVNKPKWAHLDIAGTASSDSTHDHIKKGGVGFAVRTLSRLVESL